MGFQATLFFYNPNIHPKKEYNTRLSELKEYLKELNNVQLIEGPYGDKQWFELTRGLEKEPERGKRCHICYTMRLEKTAQIAKDKGFTHYGSTLSISPHKDAQVISNIGNKLAKKYKLQFFDQDWKKNDGFKHSCDISKQKGFYRQNYCGCIYSQ